MGLLDFATVKERLLHSAVATDMLCMATATLLHTVLETGSSQVASWWT